jgi:hypothetical protein
LQSSLHVRQTLPAALTSSTSGLRDEFLDEATNHRPAEHSLADAIALWRIPPATGDM